MPKGATVDKLPVKPGKLWIRTHVVRTEQGGDKITLTDDYAEREVEAMFPPDCPVATVSSGYGLTLNMGNFESARLDAGITLPCYPDKQSIKETFALANQLVKDEITPRFAAYKAKLAAKGGR